MAVNAGTMCPCRVQCGALERSSVSRKCWPARRLQSSNAAPQSQVRVQLGEVARARQQHARTCKRGRAQSRRPSTRHAKVRRAPRGDGHEDGRPNKGSRIATTSLGSAVPISMTSFRWTSFPLTVHFSLRPQVDHIGRDPEIPTVVLELGRVLRADAGGTRPFVEVNPKKINNPSWPAGLRSTLTACVPGGGLLGAVRSAICMSAQ